MLQYKQWFVYSGTNCGISTVRYVWTLMYLEKWYVMYVQVWTVVDVCMYIEVYMCGSVQVLYCIEKCITWDVYSRVWTVWVICSKCKWHAVRNIQWYLLYDDDLLCYDLMYTLRSMMHAWCILTLLDDDDHTCYDTLYDDDDVNMLWCDDALLYTMTYILWWCTLDVDTLRWSWSWSWCIPYDDDAWWCIPGVQWKQSIITCSVIVYDEVYKDVHEQCMVVKWIVGIQGWFCSDQSVEVINNRFIVWYVTCLQVVQCGIGCAVWYRLCSAVHVMISMSTGSVQ